jgi:hypothetical protein
MKNIMPIPYSFMLDNIYLSWKDVLWGYERQLIGWSDAVHLAEERLLSGSEDPNELELASLGKSDAYRVSDLLHILANNDSHEKDYTSEKKWLFLVLAWLFKNINKVKDPLGEVEAIYADFDYPSEIEPFVRYMPSTKNMNNENNLFVIWEKYLSKTKQELK